MEKALPSIPAKRYFTIGEVSELCGVKPYVLRYWEQEFTQLKPMKRRGNRRYYQHHEVLLIRRIRELLYEQGFTISGARNRLTESGPVRAAPLALDHDHDHGSEAGSEPGSEPVFELAELDPLLDAGPHAPGGHPDELPHPEVNTLTLSTAQMRQELLSIRGLLAL